MAVNFNDPTCGFFQREVVDFINKQILQNGVSPHFYSMQMCESWGDMEKKLRDILTDSTVSEATKEACAWKTLALAVHMAERQKQEDAEKVKKLQDQLDEQNLFSNVLIGMVNRLRNAQEKEKEKAQFQLQESLTTLRGVEEERNLFRNELLRVLSTQSSKQQGDLESRKRKQAQTLSMFLFAQAAASDWGLGAGREGSRPGVRYPPGPAALRGEAQEHRRGRGFLGGAVARKDRVLALRS